ncbi:hypothetical protein IFM89_001829 [Coptis chinensis]|uniref:Uncharacterized protein n=1 Tax=Coptis chinensis TaxID=261450 RepID=A0A835HKT1_9MAGN|nr:hypothetical protein IFM89_001829 [Coptis chinensis]
MLKGSQKGIPVLGPDYMLDHFILKWCYKLTRDFQLVVSFQMCTSIGGGGGAGAFGTRDLRNKIQFRFNIVG